MPEKKKKLWSVNRDIMQPNTVTGEPQPESGCANDRCCTSTYLKQEATESVMRRFLEVHEQPTQFQHQTCLLHRVQHEPLQQLAVGAGRQQLVEGSWQLRPPGVDDHVHAAAACAGAVRRRVQAAVAVENLVIGR